MLFNLKLHLPKQAVMTAEYAGIIPNEQAIRTWLHKTKTLDGQLLLNVLVSLNRIRCKPSVRMAIMSHLEPEINLQKKYLIKQTNHITTFPLSAENQASIDILQQLLLETSMAYQIIIHDIVAKDVYVQEYLGNIIPNASFMALHYLSYLLVERFQFYLTEPDYIWQGINQLFLLAERVGADESFIRFNRTIKHQYLQITLLKLFHPYRLLSQEAREIYQLLEQWVVHCDIVGYNQHYSDNNFVVNLLSDRSAHYFSQGDSQKNNNNEWVEMRIVMMNSLYIYIDEYLASAKKIKGNDKLHLEMLKHIDNNFNADEERDEIREFAGNEIILTSGLYACHYFISEKKSFIPEIEIEWQQQKSVTQVLAEDNKLDIVPSDRYKKNINSYNNQSHFVHDFQEEIWTQRNESGQGMLLVGKNNIDMPIAVGMLVAYRLKIEKIYCLATVKWLRINPHKGIAMGLNLLAVQSRAVAIKSIQGKKELFKPGFLITKKHKDYPNGRPYLIVPAGIYDQRSVLKVWYNDKLSYVKIKQKIMATDSFEQVLFDQVTI
jgi:hypothetical protein